jgi:putative membrane protein
MHLILICTILCAVMWSTAAAAHDPLFSGGQERLASLANAVALAVLWLFYINGAKRRQAPLQRALQFHGAMLLATVATLGPLDTWAETNEAAHMAQHMLFMVVIAPLFVMSQPLPQLIKGSTYAALRVSRPLLRLARYPMTAAYIHGVAIWFWHIPYFYRLALHNPWLHIVEHACFIVSAGLFWWAVLRNSRSNMPWALLAVLTTLMHTGFLGALLTFAPSPLYGAQRDIGHQQLAGLIMWVAGAIPYITASAWIALRWFATGAKYPEMSERG